MKLNRLYATLAWCATIAAPAAFGTSGNSSTPVADEARFAYSDSSGLVVAHDSRLVVGLINTLIEPTTNSAQRSLYAVIQYKTPPTAAGDIYYVTHFEDATAGRINAAFDLMIKRGSACTYHVGQIAVTVAFPLSVPVAACDEPEPGH